MNAMVNPDVLKRFLAGTASEAEIQLCEAHLAEADVVDLDMVSTEDDSLLETVGNFKEATVSLNVEQNLKAQLISLGPGQAACREELDRILEPTDHPEFLGLIGRFQVVEFIASGGMGLVFKALDPNLERPVCIKVLHPLMAVNHEAKTRFMRESKAAARLRNERIVTVLEVGEQRGLPYLVMQLLEGESLRQRLSRQTILQSEVATKYTIQIAEGLKYAHCMGFLHRDIKPENIWITPEDDIKILDFGLARAVNETTHLTNSGTILGTPSYMSPEQVQGLNVDRRSDLFSLGSVFYEMLTGVCPFAKNNLFSTMMSVANDSLEIADNSCDRKAIPNHLAGVLEHLLQKQPENRTPSADDLITQLSNLESDLKPKAQSESSGVRLWKRVAIGLMASAVLLCVALAVYKINDKGRLVIQAAPGVEVIVKDERISVRDPESEKEFKLKIGDSPLPSGVYLLELESDEGKFRLSSQVITIRRGEQSIVEIELVPPSKRFDGARVAGNNRSPAESRPALESHGAPNSRTQKFNLDSVPTLTKSDIKKKLQLGARKLISHSLTQVEGGQSSTTCFHLPSVNSELQLNEDGQFYSSVNAESGFVSIFRSDGRAYCLIPVQSEVMSIAWSPHPNYLAIKEQKDRTVIWKLVEKQGSGKPKTKGTGLAAQIVAVINIEATSFGWSWDGSRMAFSNSGEISFYNVESKRVMAAPNHEISGYITERPWSLDGKYFTSYRRLDGRLSEVNVWNLETDELVHIFRGGEKPQFLANFGSSNSARIKFLKRSRWEVWNVDSLEREYVSPSEVKLYYKPKFWADSSMDRLAYINQSDQLIFEERSTGKKATQTLQPKFTPTEISFSGNGSAYLRTSVHDSTSQISVSFSHPNKQQAKPSLEEAVANHKRLEFSPIRSPFIKDTTYSKTRNRIAYIESGQQFTGIGVGDERKKSSNDLYKDAVIRVLDLENLNYPLKEFRSPDMIRAGTTTISPNGRWVAFGQSNDQPNDVINSSVHLIDISSGDTTEILETYPGTIDMLHWIESTGTLLVSGVRHNKDSEGVVYSLARFINVIDPKSGAVSKLNLTKQDILPIGENQELRLINARPIVSGNKLLFTASVTEPFENGEKRVRVKDSLTIYYDLARNKISSINKLRASQFSRSNAAPVAFNNQWLIMNPGTRSLEFYDRTQDRRVAMDELIATKLIFLEPHSNRLAIPNITSRSKQMGIYQYNSSQNELTKVMSMELAVPQNRSYSSMSSSSRANSSHPNCDVYWHPDHPVMIWRQTSIPSTYHFMNTQTGQHFSQSFPCETGTPVPINEGWILNTSMGLKLIDAYTGDVEKTIISVAPSKYFNQSINQHGNVSAPERADIFVQAQWSGDQFETRPFQPSSNQ